MPQQRQVWRERRDKPVIDELVDGLDQPVSILDWIRPGVRSSDIHEGPIQVSAVITVLHEMQASFG